MDFEVTCRLEEIDGNNFLIYEVSGAEPFVMGPTNPMGDIDGFRMYSVDGTCDPNGQPFYSYSVNIGVVDCSDPVEVGSGVDVTISKNGASNTKGHTSVYEDSPICPM